VGEGETVPLKLLYSSDEWTTRDFGREVFGARVPDIGRRLHGCWRSARVR
jgi:hypothetical protein